jgi:hypothetical protein
LWLSIAYLYCMDWATFIFGIIAGVAIAVTSAAILGAWNWFVAKREDTVRLSAEVSQPGEMQDIQYIGCACMIVTITCRSKRPAKIKSALIALEGVDLIPQFEKGFGASFGYVPVNVGVPPALTINLVPLKKSTTDAGFHLERDDAVRFALPIQVPVLDQFPKAPSQNVWIAVTHLDGREEVLLRGSQIQNTISDLIAVWKDQRQTLNVTLEIGLRATSAVLPGAPELMGKTNPFPVTFAESDSAEAGTQQPAAASGGTARVRLPVYTLVSSDKSTAVMLETLDGPLLPLFSTAQIADEVRGQCRENVSVRELATAEAVRSYVEHPPMKPGVLPPHFNILFDSVDPNNRKPGLVTRDCILATFNK